MATLSKLSNEDLRKARKAKFKKKAPKKPKRNASVGVLENYISRHNDWVKEAKEAIKAGARKEKLKKTIW